MPKLEIGRDPREANALRDAIKGKAPIAEAEELFNQRIDYNQKRAQYEIKQERESRLRNLPQPLKSAINHLRSRLLGKPSLKDIDTPEAKKLLAERRTFPDTENLIDDIFMHEHALGNFENLSKKVDDLEFRIQKAWGVLTGKTTIEVKNPENSQALDYSPKHVLVPTPEVLFVELFLEMDQDIKNLGEQVIECMEIMPDIQDQAGAHKTLLRAKKALQDYWELVFWIKPKDIAAYQEFKDRNIEIKGQARRDKATFGNLNK